MKKLVAELEGNELDYAVALANGWNHDEWLLADGGYNPSENWEQAGPIIEHELISLEPMTKDLWSADKWVVNKGLIVHESATPLIAAMRVFVSSKFGKYVEIE